MGKENLLKRKKSLLEGAIVDIEIDIESAWVLRNRAQKRFDEVISKIEANTKAIREEKEKTPMDTEKIEDLMADNVKLGWSSKKTKDGKPEYSGKALDHKNELGYYKNQIIESVEKRELLRKRLGAVEKLINKGWEKDFTKVMDDLAKEDEMKRFIENF